MIESLYDQYLNSTGISTDTRTIKKGQLFFALKGESFDGNVYAQKALDLGAAFAIVDAPSAVVNAQCILVDDVLKTLQSLANYHRKQLNIPIIGITGSNGKTTTKELMRLVLATRYNTFATKGNLNNHIGVPLSLLSISNTVEIAIIEMGANHVGDIAELCAIADPDHGLITNIGKAHIGEFGGFENIIRAKSELYHHLIKRNGVIWVNEEDEVLRNMAKRMANPMFYPTGYYNSSLESADPFVAMQLEDESTLTTHLLGRYNFLNVVAALAVGKFFGVDKTKAKEAIANYYPDNNRSQIVEKGGNTIILDAYNANPSSMEAALENFQAMEKMPKAVILGDMLELGKESRKEHEKIGNLLAKMNIEKAYLVGPEMNAARAELPQGVYCTTKEQLKQHADWKNKPNHGLWLIKGSRGMALETLLSELDN